MMFFITPLVLLLAWCGAVIYIRLRPSAPDGPLNAPPHLEMSTPLTVEPVIHGRLYNTVTYVAPVVVGIVVAVTFVVLMVPVFHS
jgi:hypothetical protein